MKGDAPGALEEDAGAGAHEEDEDAGAGALEEDA